MTIELNVSELSVVRHALTRLQVHNSKLLDPAMRKHYYGDYPKEQIERALLEWDILKNLFEKIPSREELESHSCYGISPEDRTKKILDDLLDFENCYSLEEIARRNDISKEGVRMILTAYKYEKGDKE